MTLVSISINMNDDEIVKLDELCHEYNVPRSVLIRKGLMAVCDDAELLDELVTSIDWLDPQKQFISILNKMAKIADGGMTCGVDSNRLFTNWPIDAMTSIRRTFGIDVDSDEFLYNTGISSIPILVKGDGGAYSKIVNPFTCRETGAHCADKPFQQFNLGEIQTIYEKLMRSYGECGLLRSDIEFVGFGDAVSMTTMHDEMVLYLPADCELHDMGKLVPNDRYNKTTLIINTAGVKQINQAATDSIAESAREAGYKRVALMDYSKHIERLFRNSLNSTNMDALSLPSDINLVRYFMDDSLPFAKL